jgi:ABC-2 type transport system ATP-binding protein
MTVVPHQDNAIEVYDLVKRYPRVPFDAVDGISFTVQRGEIFGLLGPNGAGKTTTISILTTRIRPTSGTIRIMGIDVVNEPTSVKEHIAVVPQQSNLDQSLRVREILTFHAAYHGIPRAEREARADALLTELGLANRSRDKVGYCSGGMGQRLMLARALMHTPDVLFLDEPTNRLDPQSRLFLWDHVHSLKERRVTILLTTQDMNEADRLCDRIAIMDHGRILVVDTPVELKKVIPGGTRLELRIHVPEAVPVGAVPGALSSISILNTLKALPGVLKVEEVLSLDNEERQGDILTFRLYAKDTGMLVHHMSQAIAAAGAELRDLHLTHPSLEDVFIYLTGRKLRS